MAVETGLAEGLDYDRRQFELLLGTDDAAAGMAAFLEDDVEPEFTGT